MKENKHPKYQQVLFVDSATGSKFVCGSTLQPKEKATFEGKEYPVCHVAVSSASHPYYKGGSQFVDTQGRVDRFLKKYAAPAKKPSEKPLVKPVAKSSKGK